jgi:hypothetical protein
VGILIIGAALVASVLGYVLRAGRLYVLLGDGLRLTTTRPKRALNDHYAVISIATVWPLLFLTAIGVVLFAAG